MPTNTPVPPTNTAVPPNDLIFASNFDAGNLNEWAQQVTDNGNLQVTSGAALVGSAGLQVTIDDNNALYVGDTSPSNERAYRMRFYFDPNSISMSNGNQHFIAVGYAPNGAAVNYVELRFNSGQYRLRAAQVVDRSVWHNTSWFPISDEPHSLELNIVSSTSIGAKNGLLEFWIDDGLVAQITGLDTDTRSIETMRLGPVSGVDSGTRGTYFFDNFESRRTTFIGSPNLLIIASLDQPTEDQSIGVGEDIEMHVPDENEVVEGDGQALPPENGLYLPLIGNQHP